MSVDVRKPRRFTFETGDKQRLSHYMFKYPAKFHPPVVRQLIKIHARGRATILDPFCGSGTLLVEAGAAGFSAIGVDVDPLAVFVSQVKVRRYQIDALRRSCGRFLAAIAPHERSEKEYVRRQFEDVGIRTMTNQIRGEELPVPDIPNIGHWFRHYVILDLGRQLKTLQKIKVPKTHRDFLLLCFGSILRAASNADPVPVSGLEVTSHMVEKDKKGRIINPFGLLRKAVARSLDDVEAFQKKLPLEVELTATHGDSTELSSHVLQPVDLVITSPPYNGAVDYYRRHLLEMFWLGLVSTRDERLELLPKYIGRSLVPQRHPFVANGSISTPLVKSWYSQILKADPKRADAFKHYVVAMSKALQEISSCLKPKGKALFIVGRSRWNGKTIPTDKLFVELAGSALKLVDHLWYGVENRYMSYTRHNGANIDKEYILVFQKTPA